MAALSILFLSSCSDPATVGIELAPGNNQIGVFYQELTLDAQVVLLDSFNTVNSGVLVVGNEADAFFGKTQATGYSRLFIDATDTRPDGAAVLDSMFFNVDVVSVNGSNLDSPKRYSVHQLTEPILDTLYYNFDKLSYQADPFASIDITFGDVKDTVMQLTVNEAFQQELFGKIQEGSEFSNLINFRKYIQGVALRAREGDNTTIGVALGANTGIAVYYHNTGDTIPLLYEINTSSSRNFNGIEADRSGTPTESVTEYGKSYDVGPQVGMKSTVAMAMRIDTSPLDAFLDTLSGVTFNQVSFSMGEIESQDEDNNPITGMVMIFVDNENEPIKSTINNVPLYVQGDNQPQVILDSNGDKVPNNTYSSSAILSYDSDDELYLAGITSHINAIYRGDILRQNWLLYASTPQTGDDFKRSLRQYKVDKNKIKIQIIYSKTR
ncbi:DUF4270 family protein [Algoriphagus sp. H41]|uniref:DUF4270 family protein n=1 Tax=Algoriphagus oliviformis TaxID=2811231 RepID=A0ABS3BYX3_9BACT|nr:DUF4270 family protein [Algoriphagus oliviformis]MBN7810058.1 DUF4270 family protein [Algoriphagus oliviformis]